MSNQFKNIEDFIQSLRTYGCYSFSWEELTQNFTHSKKALRQSLYRLKTKGKIAMIRSGFYAIIPSEYSKQGMIPPGLFIDDFMKVLKKRYYVGLFTAAGLHGASHQATMEYYVVIEKPTLRNIKKDKLSINFYVKKGWSNNDVMQRKTDAGYIYISLPELTALDLLSYGNFGISRIYTVIEELSEEMKVNNLKRVAENFGQTSSIQRLGYLLDRLLHSSKLAKVLETELLKRKTHLVPLVKGSKEKGNIDSKWKVIQSTTIESDL